MPVYAANILDIARPVEEVKEKKVRSEKQIAAFAKAAETRRLKKEAASAEKEAVEKANKEEAEMVEKKNQEEAQKEELKRKAKEEKLELAREKRKAKKQKVETTEDGLKEVTDSVTSEKVEDDKPPKWFEQYIQGVKKEENSIAKEKKPAKMVRIEAKETAQQHWNNGLTRDRVKNEVDGHMDRLYTQIFANRRM